MLALSPAGVNENPLDNLLIEFGYVSAIIWCFGSLLLGLAEAVMIPCITFDVMEQMVFLSRSRVSFLLLVRFIELAMLPIMLA